MPTEARLSPEAECEIARRILAIEQELTTLLRTIPACREILDARSGRVGRTRAAAVNRLEAAVVALDDKTGADPKAVSTAKRRWAEAQELRWRLALSATRVVYREAHRLAGNPVVSVPDLVQEGLIGLLDAAKRFEPDRDNRFATYARWWARAHMTRAIDLARLVHLSAGASEQLRNLRKQIRLHDMAGASWTVQDLANELGMDVERARILLGVGNGQSLDEVSEDGEAPTGLQIADESRPAPDLAAAESQEVQLLRHAIKSALPERQRHIVMNRYGIGREARSLTDIARGMRLSRERVRQLERDSLQLLRDACAKQSQVVAARRPRRQSSAR
jgi:RNA polymerase sigma factor (sigma-70 family)